MATLQAARADGGTKKTSLKRAAALEETAVAIAKMSSRNSPRSEVDGQGRQDFSATKTGVGLRMVQIQENRRIRSLQAFRLNDEVFPKCADQLIWTWTFFVVLVSPHLPDRGKAAELADTRNYGRGPLRKNLNPDSPHHDQQAKYLYTGLKVLASR